jgi:predicted nucleic acid-binding Zn ribbon protein
MEPKKICPICHQPILPEYYFCPNCGNKLNSAPLSISTESQLKLYAHSIVLPLICFVTAGKWQGIKYFKAEDKKTKNVGIVACALLILSTLIMIWLVVVWTNQAIQSSINSINTDFSGI